MIRSAVRIAVISLIAGWLASVGFALLMARLQYLEIYDSRTYNVPRAVLLLKPDPRWHIFDPATFFAPDRVAAEYEWRIARKLIIGSALILPQMLVVSAIMAGQVMQSVRRNGYQPLHFGAITGGLVGIIICLTLLALQTLPALAPTTGMLIMGVGIFAAVTAPVTVLSAQS